MATAPAGSLYIDIVTNIAKLQADMNRMKAAVGGAVGSVNSDLTQGAMATQRYLDSMDRMSTRSGTAIAGMGKQAGLTRAHMMNLGYQVNDLIVSLASGQKPMMVFMQQGSQIAQIGAQAGVGLGGMARGVLSMAGNFARAHPILLAVTAALGGTVVGFKLLGEEMGKDAHLDAYAKKLGLTKEQIDKAGGATVTFGDMTKGLWKTISDGLGLDGVFKSIKGWATDAFMTVLKWAKDSAVGVYAYYGAAFDTVKAVWKNFPSIMGEFFGEMVNVGIRKVNSLISTVTQGLNLLAAGMNTVFGTKIHALSAPQIKEMKNEFAGAGKEIGDTFSESFNRRWAAGQAAADRFIARLVKNIDDAARARLRAADDDEKKKKKHSDALAKEIASMEAAIKSLWALADAYEMGEAAAMRAEAAAKANEKAIRKEGDYAVFYALELRKAVAERAEAAGKLIGSLNSETAAQAEANRLVKEGLLTSDQAQEYMKKEAQLRPVLVAQENAHGEELENLTKKYDALSPAIDNNNRVKREAAALAEAEKNNDEIARLELEAKLIGATNRERAVMLAQLAVAQKYHNGDGMDPEVYAGLLRSARNRVLAQEDLNDRQDAYNRLLTRQLDLLDALDQRARAVADGLAEAFGRPGEAMGRLLTEFTSYAKQREETERRLATLAEQQGRDSDAYQDARIESDREAATLEISHWNNILAASKSFFKEGSAGYKLISALEKARAALQLANMIKAAVLDRANTASSVANSMTRGAADAAAGAAKMFSTLGPAGFVAVAAMVAVLASMGLKGLRGGGKGPTIPTAEDVQKAQGTRTVLGDSSAKSDSIAKSLDLIEKHVNRDLEFSSDMARSLRSIDSNIGGLSGLIARQMGVSGGMFDTSGLGLGTTRGTNPAMFGAIGAIGTPIGAAALALVTLGKKIPIVGDLIGGIVNALFGTKKTVTLLDQGLTFATQSVQDILNGGIVGNIFQTVQTQTKKKFLGLTVSNKTKTSDQLSGLDADMANQIGLLVSSLRDGVLSAATALGIDGAQAVLDSFEISLGKISFKDLSGEEIEKELQAVFSRVADDMAGSVVGGLGQFQKVGEGLFETLSRLARDYQVVDVTLQSIGKTFGSVGVASVGARENLIDLFGGLDNFTQLTSQFADAFLSEAERMAPVQAAVAKAMSDLGLASITSKDAFKQTVLGLDLTTEAGQEMYAKLLAIAPAFAKVSDYVAKLNGTAEETGKTAEQLAQIEKQRRSLEIALMEAQGRSEEALAAKRADELAALDESLRPLQEAIYAAQDAAEAQKALAAAQEEAARAAAAVASERRGLEIRLLEAQGDAAGALAMKREDELAALDESNRALLQQIFALEDAAAASEALNQVTMTAAEIARTRRSLEIELMRATGDAAGALAAERADELAALDPTLRALQQAVWAAQDAAAAQEALNAVHQTAAELAKSRHDLELRLLEAQGRDADLLAAKRADEMAATDDSLKALLQSIYAAEDAAKAQQALAAAEAEAAQKAADLASARRSLEIRLMEATGDAAGALAAKRADEMAAMDETLRPLLALIYAAEDAAAAGEALNQVTQTAAEIAKTRRALEIDLMEATGRTAEALAAKRADELAAMDASLRPLQEQVWAAQDAAEAQKALADAQAEAARAAQELADKRADLEIRLLRATGHEIEAVAMERQRELAATDESLRGLLEQVYAAEDAKAAMEQQSGALADTISRFKDLGQSLREFRASLAGAAALSTEEVYRAAATKFAGLAGKARLGDADAMGALASAGQDFLTAAKDNAASALDYKRDVGFVAGAVDAAIRAADAQLSDAQRQLAAEQEQIDLLTMVNGSVMSVHDAIMAAADRGAQMLDLPAAAYVSPTGSGADTSLLEARIDMLAERIEPPLRAIAVSTKRLDDRTLAWDDAGSCRISTDGQPIEVTGDVTVDGQVEVVNPEEGGEPVPLYTVSLG